ncbi:MAG: hypothetical protein ACKV2Q_08850 [Planctomycetaceae bacterium]
MPLNVQCDSCGHKYRMPDHLAGETVPCKECGEDISVPGRRRSRGAAREPERSSWLVENKIGVAVGAGVLLLLVVLLVVLLNRGGGPAPVANNPGMPGNGGAPQLPVVNPGLPRANVGNAASPSVPGAVNAPSIPQPVNIPRPPAPAPNANRNVENANTPVVGGRRGGFAPNQPTGSEIESLVQKRDGLPFDEVTAGPNEMLVTYAKQAGQPDRVAKAIAAATPVQWNVTPDPLPDSVIFSNKPISIPGPEQTKLIVSRTLSPVVMFGDPSADFVLVNLSTMTQSKPLRMSLSRESFAVSPDGDKIASLSSSDQTSSDIGLFQASNGRLLRTLTVEGNVSREMFEFIDKDRLVVSLARGGGKERLAVIDIGSGNKLCEPDIGDDGRFEQVQISPGGRYLLHVAETQGLIVCDSRSGQRVGAVPLPRVHRNERNMQTLACGVSPDGQEFAAILDDQINQHHLLLWNLERGQQTLHHVLEMPELRNLRFGSSRPMKLEFINGGGFLVEGAVWIDRNSGAVAWQDRNAGSPINRDSGRRLLPDNRLLMVETRERNFSVLRDRPNARLTVVDLGRISGQSVSRGEEPVPPVIPQTNQSQRLTLPAENVAWNVVPDPSASRELLKRPRILGQALNGAAADYQYAITSTRLAVVDQPRRSATSLSTAARLRVYDTNSGEQLFESSVPPQTVALAISSDGRWLATTSGAGAISLWAFDAARPRLTFTPHKAGGKIQLCRFLEDGRLLVSSQESKDRHRVSLWKVPECEQVYDLELGTREIHVLNMKAPFSIRAAKFSHSGRYLVIDEGDRFRFMEASTGKIVGDLANAWARTVLVDGDSWDQMPFSSDGRLFAVRLPTGAFELLSVWDMTTGQLREQFSVARSNFYVMPGMSRDMSFCGPNHLLVEDRLIDLTHHAVIWSYPFLRGVKLIDGTPRMLRLLDVPAVSGQIGVLAESEFPVAEAVAAVREVRANPLPLVFGRGAQVTLDVSQLGGLPADAQARIKTTAEAGCRQYGVELIPNSQVVLKFEITGGKSETHTFGDSPFNLSFGQQRRPSEQFQLTGTSYRLRASLGIPNADPYWLHEGSASSMISSFMEKEGESAAVTGQRLGQEQFVSHAEQFFTHLQFPPQMYAQPRFAEPRPAGLPQPGPGRPQPVEPPRHLGFGFTAAQQLKPPDPTALNAALTSAVEMQRRSFEHHCQEVAHRAYAEVVTSDAPEVAERWKWSPALQRPVIGLRWGFAVQYSGKKPDNAYVFPQPNYQSIVESMNELTAGSAPRLIGNVEYLASQGRFGQWPVGRNSLAREVVLLGGGSLGELLAAAKSARLDFLVAAHFTTQAGGPTTSKKKGSTTAMTFRLFDVSLGKMLFETSPLKAADLGKNEKDASAEAADEMLRFIDENVAPQPLTELSKDVLKTRLESLNAKDSANPIADAAELQLYVRKGWATEPQIQRAATRLLGDANSVRALLHGSAEDRQALATKLEPKEVRAK